jgi:hypothetical protein
MTVERFIFWLPEEETAVHAEEILALLVLQRVQLNKSDRERNKKYNIARLLLSELYYWSSCRSIKVENLF